jgi:redox-sensitive bicupin YhaK (pirin superfamily)
MPAGRCAGAAPRNADGTPTRRGGYAYVIEGAVTLDDEKLAGGDSARVIDHDMLRITAIHPSELILVDVPLRWEPVGVWA